MAKELETLGELTQLREGDVIQISFKTPERTESFQAKFRKTYIADSKGNKQTTPKFIFIRKNRDNYEDYCLPQDTLSIQSGTLVCKCDTPLFENSSTIRYTNGVRKMLINPKGTYHNGTCTKLFEGEAA